MHIEVWACYFSRLLFSRFVQKQKCLHLETRYFFYFFQKFREQNELNSWSDTLFLGMYAKNKCAKFQRQIINFFEL